MENRLKIWLLLIGSGIVISFGVIIGMKAARLPEFWAWLTGVSVLVNFMLAGMVGNARNSAERANSLIEHYRQQALQASYAPVADIYSPVFEVDDVEATGENRELSDDEVSKLRQEETKIGFQQAYRNPSPTPPESRWYRGVDGVYRQRRRQGRA